MENKNTPMLSHPSKIIHYKQSIVEIYFELVRYKNASDYSILFDRISNLLKSIKMDIQVNMNGPGAGAGAGPSIYYLRLLYKLIAQTRDVQHGKGERTLTYVMIHAWYSHYPLFSIFALKKMVYYGCWKDLNYFCDYIFNTTRNQNHPLIIESIAYINKQLCTDLKSKNNNNNNNISYVAKWIPRENHKFHWIFDKLVCNWFNLCVSPTLDTSYYYGEYRKIIAGLNRKLNTIEISMCSNDWQHIGCGSVSGSVSGGQVALFKHQNALLNVTRKYIPRLDMNHRSKSDRNTCSDNFKHNICGYLNRHEDSNNKQHPFSSHHSIGFYVKEAFSILDNQNVYNIEITNLKLALLNKKWQHMISSIHNICYGYSIPMVDVSAHMTTGDSMALFNAIGFGCLIADKSLIHKRILLMDYEPKWVILDSCVDFISMIVLIRKSYIGNTTIDFDASMKMIMTTMDRTCISNETISKMKIVILSNIYSQNDRIQKYNLFETFREFTQYPQMIYWNLSDTGAGVDMTYPCYYDSRSCMLSGTQFNNMNVLGLKYLYAFDTIEYILTNPHYYPMDEYILGILGT